MLDIRKMYPQVSTKNPAAVEAEVEVIYRSLFREGDPVFIGKAFYWATECFTGNYRNYQAIDARYHDFEHTLQGTLCMSRLLRGRTEAKGIPALTKRMFELGLMAILLHDTGYLKTRNDMAGTGAKYTLIHVNRSAEFAAALLQEKGFAGPDILAVQNMIRCTGVNADLNAIPFQDELERTVGFSLGSADLLGQMAAEDYIEKLPILYLEFAESQRFNRGNPSVKMIFTSAEDLIRKTPAFWEKYVIPKINHDFLGLYHFLEHPYPNGRNEYIERIQGNIDRLKKQLDSGML